MERILGIMMGLLLVINVFGQNDKVTLLISEGTQLHDQGKYDDAIVKYKAALDIDKNSSEANYELSFTYMVTGKYDEAIAYSKKVIDKNDDIQQGAYIVLGTSWDMKGKPEKAIKAYQDGLTKFPQSSLLSYNLALTLFNQKEYDKAEDAAVQAISNNPNHASSHLVLSAIMQAQGLRVKSILPLYYFLLLEPNSKRSETQYSLLLQKLGQRVVQKDEKNISVSLQSFSSNSDSFSAAEMMVSLQAATRYTKENTGKSDMEFFKESTPKIFRILSELKKDSKGFWWDLYVTKFQNLEQAGCCEAFCYYISQSDSTKGSKSWIFENPGKMQEFMNWMNPK